MANDPKRLLSFKTLTASALLFAERVWHALFWPTMVAGSALLLVLSGLDGYLPSLAVKILLVLFVAAFVISLRELINVRWPAKAEAVRRIETASKLKHRPASALNDTLASDCAGDVEKSIWKAHQVRQLAAIRDLKTGSLNSRWMYRDPNALRFTLALLLIAVFVLRGGDISKQVLDPLSGHAAAGKGAVQIDAWISPPAFTEKPPIMLTSRAVREKLENGIQLLAPEGSKLIVRLNNASKPVLVGAALDLDGNAGKELFEKSFSATGKAGIFELSTKLSRPVHITVLNNGKTVASWPVALIPDTPPSVKIDGSVAPTVTGAFTFKWQVSDDYGVAGLSGKLVLVRAGTDMEKAALPYDLPPFNISMPRLNPKQARGKAFRDLASHPLAGSLVSLVLTARDQAGQTASSKPVQFRLPTRQFSKPLAQVLIEQRRNLVIRGAKNKAIVKILAAMTAWPKGLFSKSGQYLAFIALEKKLAHAGNDRQLRAIVKDMWELAVLIEDGDMSDALRRLEAARRELQKALRDGASKQRIAELTANLRKALNEYMQALARQAQKNQPDAGKTPPGRALRQRDLQQMMDNIENLARSGANDAAQEMLSQLENILKNLRPGLARPMDPQRMPPMARALDELSRMMRQQQQLMDRTFKMPGGQKGNNGQRSNPGKQTNRATRPGNRLGNDLSMQQDDLQKMLGELMQRLQNNGLPVPDGLNQARREMQGAAKSLGKGDSQRALGQQGRSLQGMRQGARAMARNLMQRGVGNEGNFGRHGEAGNERTDPLGRPMPGNARDLGPRKNMLPGEAEIRRAREIIEALRKRANQPDRPPVELRYLDRLLRGIY